MRTNDLIIVKAKVSMKTTAEEGRVSGFKSGYRPNHVFELADNVRNLQTYVGGILFDGQELIEPGETKIVTVKFLKIPQIEKYMVVGQKWFINEATRTLGFGEILENSDRLIVVNIPGAWGHTRAFGVFTMSKRLSSARISYSSMRKWWSW